MNKRYKKFWAAIGGVGFIAVVLSNSFPSILKSVDYVLQSNELTLGVVLMGAIPFFMVLSEIRKEADKRKQARRIEQRQLEIEQRQVEIKLDVMEIKSDVRDIMSYLGVESTWSLPVIGSNAMDPKNSKKWLPIFTVAMRKHTLILRRKKRVDKQNINYMTLIPTILGAAKLILQTFGIDIPDETINEVVNGAAAVGTIVGIFLAHRKGTSTIKPQPTSNDQNYSH